MSELQGADAAALNDQEQTPLYMAVEAKQASAVHALCSAAADTVNQADEWGLTPLHIAARAGSVDTVIRLLLAQVTRLCECVLSMRCVTLHTMQSVAMCAESRSSAHSL